MINNISEEYRQFYLSLVEQSNSFKMDMHIFEYISDIIGVDIEYILDVNNIELMNYYKANNKLNLEYFDKYTFKKLHECNIDIYSLALTKSLKFEKIFLFNEIIKIGVPIYDNKDQTEHIRLDIYNAYTSLLVDFINYFDSHKNNIRNIIQKFL